jgi:CheY-like chemotaxis protein
MKPHVVPNLHTRGGREVARKRISGRSRPPRPVRVVAVLNSNQDVLRLIRGALQDEGYTVVTEHIVNFKDGAANLLGFLTAHRPAVVVYDVAPPYEENWNFLQLLCRVPEVAEIPMVLTTVNKRALEKAVGATKAFEILGTRDNLAPLVAEINRSVRSRPVFARPRHGPTD